MTAITRQTLGTRIRGIAVRFGAERRTNDWYEEHEPEALASARERNLARAFTVEGSDEASRPFDEVMQRYVEDPFRGARVRYKLGPDETSRTLETASAREVLDATGVEPDSIDCILCASWLPESYVAPGNAVYLARELGVRAPAINLETACSSGLAGLEIAEGLLAVGRYRRILLVLSNTLSRQAPDDNTLSWISSDVAAAALLEADESGSDLVASALENTAETCGAFEHEIVGPGQVVMSVGKVGTKALRDHSGPAFVERLCRAALDRAALDVDDVSFFGFSTPLAWFAEMCCGAVGVPMERANDLFPRMGNLGLPFPLVHLWYARHEGRLGEGEPALLYTAGSTSSAGAMVIRGADWRLGAHPEHGR